MLLLPEVSCSLDASREGLWGCARADISPSICLLSSRFKCATESSDETQAPAILMYGSEMGFDKGWIPCRLPCFRSRRMRHAHDVLSNTAQGECSLYMTVRSLNYICVIDVANERRLVVPSRL